MSEPTHLVRVETARACFGFEVRVDGQVGRRAPYTARAARGRTARALVGYWRGRGAKVTWKEIGATSD